MWTNPELKRAQVNRWTSIYMNAFETYCFPWDHNSRHAAHVGSVAPSGFDRQSGGRERIEAAVFFFSLLDCCMFIFLSAYFIITLFDLECDYINARSCCSKLSKWVIPELIGHTIVTVIMLVSLPWFIFLLNLPVATWNIYCMILALIND
uniref:protein cornichon homolog 4-like n=1 Tax=Jaculus jaculus TaxID=51337 RepID=UPI001E1B06D8|nr:protein cornichon homolog 4-like [Jaculus jaculus]